VAGGWERRRSLFAAATHDLSERLVDLADPQPGDSVLELAAGPGDTGFSAAARVGPSGHLLSTDFASEMVEVARRRGAELGVENASFQVVDAADTGLPDDSADVIICRFGVMLVPDCSAALAEIGRVLRPGGRVAIAVWAEVERNDWIAAPAIAARALGLAPPPEPDAPGPFRLADVTVLRGFVESAGLAVSALEEVAVTWAATDHGEWWDTVVDMSPALAILADSLPATTLARLRERAIGQLERFTAPDGSLAVPGVARAVRAVPAV
jgi:SAM-dependent methyltransferase